MMLTALLLAATPGPQCTPEHAAMGHCKMPAATPAPADEDPDCPREHAEMGHCTPRAAASAKPAPVAPPAAVAADYADRKWDPVAMAAARAAMHREHGGAEVTFGKDGEGYRWEADAWFGGDINRLALTAEGEGEFDGALESIELQAFYQRAIDPYFNLRAGIRHDIRPDPSRTYFAVGVAGLAPYWFEVGTHVYLSTRGEVRAEASAEYDQRLTQRLIVQPRIEFDLAAQDMRDIGVGAGLVSAEFGLRLRYEIAREFAPYIGIVHETKTGRTADFARAAGEHASSTAVVVGVRAWF
jgi:copper resistance protein B